MAYRFPEPDGGFIEGGPDGNRYYVIFGVPVHLLSMYTKLVIAQEAAARVNSAAAIEISILIRDVRVRMDYIAMQTAAVARDSVRFHIGATRKRPRSVAGVSQSGRLDSGIVAKPLPVVLPRGGGGVGVGQIEALEAATAGGHRTKSGYNYYWRTQEDGSDAMVGRYLYGVFQPGERRPSGSEFRQHPIFEERRYYPGIRYKMLVTRPVQARHFLKDGAGEAYLFRHEQIAAAERVMVARLAEIERTLFGRGGSLR